MPTPNHAGPESRSFPLPPPLAELVSAHREEPEGEARDYFAPQSWNLPFAKPQSSDDQDPVAKDAGRREGEGTAALFVSDFHLESYFVTFARRAQLFRVEYR